MAKGILQRQLWNRTPLFCACKLPGQREATYLLHLLALKVSILLIKVHSEAALRRMPIRTLGAIPHVHSMQSDQHIQVKPVTGACCKGQWPCST